MLFSHVKVSSFRGKAHLLFHWCLYNNDDYHFSLKNQHSQECLNFTILRLRNWSSIASVGKVSGLAKVLLKSKSEQDFTNSLTFKLL